MSGAANLSEMEEPVPFNVSLICCFCPDNFNASIAFALALTACANFSSSSIFFRLCLRLVELLELELDPESLELSELEPEDSEPELDLDETDLSLIAAASSLADMLRLFRSAWGGGVGFRRGDIPLGLGGGGFIWRPLSPSPTLLSREKGDLALLESGESFFLENEDLDLDLEDPDLDIEDCDLE